MRFVLFFCLSEMARLLAVALISCSVKHTNMHINTRAHTKKYMKV